ncbi:MAG: murein biosynthesis integral membrane protein MurJ [Synergistota bacterium]|nr:murein biosynthesis integral membrane protein MurJ [Synergistota bacterium]
MSNGSTPMVRHSLKMMAGTLLSRLLGLAREVMIAALFGATGRLDAFLVAYTLANLARRLLAEGALSAAFVPVFSQTLERDGLDKASELARQAFTVLAVVTGATVALGVLAAPALVRVMAPGFGGEATAAAVRLTRLMFPFLFFISLAALAMGVLNSMGSFFVPAIAPALSNVVFIAFLAIVASRMGVTGLACAVLLGGVSQLILQWLWSAGNGVPLYPAIPRRDNAELKRTMTLFLPYALGLSLNQLIPVISRMLGSFLQEGSISVLNYADRILQLPLGLFVIAISQAVLPFLSRKVLDGEAAFAAALRDALRFALFIVIPVVAGMAVFSNEIVHLLFVRGAFGDWAWLATGKTLAMYGLGLPGMACTTVLLRALYARGMPRAAIYVTGFSVAANLVFSLLLMGPFAYAGLALASSLAFTGSAFLALYLLRRGGGACFHGLFDGRWLRSVVCGLAAMTAVLLALKTLAPYSPDASLALRGGWMMLPLTLGPLAYGFVTWKMGSEEWKWITEAVKKP